MKHKLKYKLTNNLGLKLISVLAACVIWLLVMDNNDPVDTQAYKNISVTRTNEDTITNANKTYSVVDDTDKVNVYVTARRSVRSKLNISSFTVKADMENYNEALGSVPLEVSCSNPAVQQEQLRIQPSSLKINMEDKIEQNFGIVAKTTGETAKGTELGRVTVLTGDTIRIAGPQSLINIIGKVTVPVDITGKSTDSTDSYTIRIEDKNGTILNESQMSNLELKNMDGVVLKDNKAEVYTEIWNIYGDITLDAVLTGTPAEGYNVTAISVSPKTVNLVASEQAMRTLGHKLQIKDKFNIQGITENQTFQVDLNDTLDLYNNIRLEADMSSVVTVDVQVEEAGTRTVEYPVSELTLKNVPANKKLIFSPTDKILLSIQGEQGEYKVITEKDISAQIDLQQCRANGNYTLPVEVTLPEGYFLTSEVTIVVNVEDEEQEEEVELLTEG
ncbi:MAG: CdaR family protein [Eubacteriales bacterium]|nr:CdaR family protein [Eubacteriales bacterium]